MKILFLSGEYPPDSGCGGIGGYVAAMSSIFARRGHEVHVLSCQTEVQPCDNVENGIHIYRRKCFRTGGAYGSLLFRTRDRFNLGISTYIWTRRLGVSFDVVEYPEWNAEGWMFALHSGMPRVVHLHTPLSVIVRHCRRKTSPDVRLASYLERFSAEKADRVTSPSGILAQEVVAEGWKFGNALSVVPYPVNCQTWAQITPPSAAPPVAQYIGRIEPRKAPETLVDAIGLVRKEMPQATARFVGKAVFQGHDGIPAMPWCSERNFDGCTFPGELPPSSLPATLASCRVVAQPSLFENFSLAGIESMAAGRALIVTSTSGLADFVTRNQCGHVVPPRDAYALAAALKQYLADPNYADMMGKRAQDAVMSELDPAKIAEMREKIYTEAIDRFGG